MNIISQNCAFSISKSIFWNMNLRGGRNRTQTNHRPVFHMENGFGQKKKAFPPVYFIIFKTNVFAWPQNPPKSLFAQLYVQPSSNILYLTVHIPISHWAHEYPRFLHAAITPSISQQFLAKSNSIWQMMTWSQCDSCFCAHTVIQ